MAATSETPLGPIPDFQDFDDATIYREARANVTARHARNFVVEFGASRSQIAWDLNRDDFSQLLAQKRDDDEFPVRWINIWNHENQGEDARGIIDDIGHHYGFSTRLTEIIKTWDDIKPQVKKLKQAKCDDSTTRRTGTQSSRPASLDVVDPERAVGRDGEPIMLTPVPRASCRRPPTTALQLQYLMLTHDLLNYTSLDKVAGRFICVGANWLYGHPGGYSTSSTLVPPSHWAWYALCSENGGPDTVVTFHEAPYLSSPGSTSSSADNELESMRARVFSLVCQLSRHGEDEFARDIFQIAAVRRQLADQALSPAGGAEASAAAVEGASNLFYYLFDEYTAIMPMLNLSKIQLDTLAERVLQSGSRGGDNDDTIPGLYHISKELRQLQHLFESYKALIGRILEHAEHRHHDYDYDSAFRVRAHGYRPHLATSARDRFLRLGDRLQLLLLDTMSECLTESASLSSTFFSLTAQRDSLATARLTRSATLLAKLSVFFVPISFVAAFFSVEVEGVLDGFTPRTYWIVLIVVISLSFLSLFFFGRLLIVASDSLDALSGKLLAECWVMWDRLRARFRA